MTDASLERLGRLRSDFEYFGAECLRIRTKGGTLEPLVLNDAQREIHRLLEQQRADKGWVRAMILKGRQQGASTYIGARFYHKTSLRKGVNTYILTHEQPATDTLFGMVDRYQKNNPIAPHVGASNAKELEFDRLLSSYAVATAGTKAGGRSKAISLYHGSEVAYWANAPDHFAASVQGVPLEPGTEIVLESTSAGAMGEFYERWQDAEAGRGDYIPIFIPWFMSREYARDPEPGFMLEQEADEGQMSEAEYAETWKLSARQMAWRRAKIVELRSPMLFQREYPASPAEAWTPPPGMEPFIAGLSVMRARKRRGIEAVGPLIIGVDPASNGGDRFSVCWRRGMCIVKVEYRNKINHLEGTAWIREIIDRDKPMRVNIDAGNIGAAVITGLKSLGGICAEVVRGVNFGGTSEWRFAKPKVPGPYNRRAEMWMRLRDWLLFAEGASIPDDNALQSDMTAPRNKPRLDNFFLLESKEDMKKRSVRSPDLADAAALTFAFKETFANWDEPAKVSSFGNVDARQPAAALIPYDAISSPQAWMS